MTSVSNHPLRWIRTDSRFPNEFTAEQWRIQESRFTLLRRLLKFSVGMEFKMKQNRKKKERKKEKNYRCAKESKSRRNGTHGQYLRMVIGGLAAAMVTGSAAKL